MAQNSNNNTSLEDAVRHVNIAFENLTLAMQKIDEAKNEDERSQTTRVFRVRQNAIRAISNAHRLHIPSPSLTVDFYNALRAKLDISDELQQNQFQGNHKFKSPLDFVNILVSNHDANGEAVEKLFEKQYEIKWHTETGDPDPFSFYKFCKSVEDAGGEDVMTYDTRRAHVFSRLYKKQEVLRKIRGLTYKELCPPIYACCERSRWLKCTYTSEGWQFRFLKNGISWISNRTLREYIQQNSKKYETKCCIYDKKFLDDQRLPGQLYWAVFEEDDYNPHRQPRERLPFNKTQVYVGKAANGIKQRWLGSTGTSHCKMMEFARDFLCNMRGFDPIIIQLEQLVDLRLLLHKACNRDGSNSGLFIMKTGALTLKSAERRNIDGKKIGSDSTILRGWKPTDMRYGLNKR